MIIGNEQFDPSNKDEPIKRLITDQYFSYFSPRELNYYNMYIGLNTYEIESGIFNSKKTGQFFTITKENIHTSELKSSNKSLLNFDIRLDSEAKHYVSSTYGIIDAIGTLGGVFEILYWFMMLFYSSLRENMYSFSVINSLNQTNQDEVIKPTADDSKNRDAPTSSNKFDQFGKI